MNKHSMGCARQRAEAFFLSPSKEKGSEGPYNKSIGPEEATVRNGEGLSGRRAIGHRRRGHSDTYGYPNCLLTGPRTERHRRKSYRAGPRLPPNAVKRVRGGTFRPGFAIEEVCVFETGLHLRRSADGGCSDRGGVGLFVPGPSPQGAAVGLLRGPAARAQGRGRPGTAQQSAAGPLPPLYHGGADRVFPRRAPYPFL